MTARLRLRRFERGDAAKLFAMSREDALVRWLPDQVYRDLDHAADVAARLRELSDLDPIDPRVHPFVLGVVADRELIGHVGLSAARGSVEIGYAIEAARAGRGLATEAVMELSTWALEALGLPEVLGIVKRANVASCRVLEKAGFTDVHDDGDTRVMRRAADPAAWRICDGLDIEWLARDRRGAVAFMTSAGFGRLPPSVMNDLDATHALMRVLDGVRVSTTARGLPGCEVPFGCWRDAAERGLYGYDCARSDATYHRLAAPELPISVHDLPLALRALAVPLDLDFAETPTITHPTRDGSG